MTIEIRHKANWLKPWMTSELKRDDEIDIMGPALFSFLGADPIKRVLVAKSIDEVMIEDRHIPEEQGMLHRLVGNNETKLVTSYTGQEINDAKLKVKPPLVFKKVLSLVVGSSTEINWKQTPKTR